MVRHKDDQLLKFLQSLAGEKYVPDFDEDPFISKFKFNDVEFERRFRLAIQKFPYPLEARRHTSTEEYLKRRKLLTTFTSEAFIGQISHMSSLYFLAKADNSGLEKGRRNHRYF